MFSSFTNSLVLSHCAKIHFVGSLMILNCPKGCILDGWMEHHLQNRISCVCNIRLFCFPELPLSLDADASCAAQSEQCEDHLCPADMHCVSVEATRGRYACQCPSGKLGDCAGV